MKRTIIAGLTLSLLASTLVMAEPPAWAGRGHGEGDHQQWHRGERGGGEYRHWRYESDRGERRGRRRFDADRYRQPPGYGYHFWVRGDRLPIAYRAPRYIIPDLAAYGLAPPPPGYYWVRVDNSAVLAAIATGIVLDVVNNAFR